MGYAFIENNKDHYSIEAMSRLLNMAVSNYYAWKKRGESRRSINNKRLLADIERIYSAHKGRYGAPRIHAQLVKEGRGCSRKSSPARRYYLYSHQ